MAAVSLLSLQWLLACAGCAVAGLLAWLLLDGGSRLWPALRTRRAVWLAGLIVSACSALLPFLPHSSSAAQFTIAAPATSPTSGAVAEAREIEAAPEIDIVEPHGSADIVPLLAALWLFVYVAGLAWAIIKQLRARRWWRGLLAAAERLSPQALQGHIAFTEDQLREIRQRRLTVLRTDAAISPMLIGVVRPRLLLPARLDALSREQQQMIISHELHHWRARDPLCLAIAAILQTIFWFNPALRWMTKQMAWALELSCDQHVLSGRPQQQRKQYAAALLQQWTTIMPAGAAAFGGGATITARIHHMQQDGLPALSAAATWLVSAALTAILALGAMLQPALAFSDPDNAKIVQAPTAVATPPAAWRAPLDNVRVTSFFGIKRSILPTPHKGIDFGGAKGTAVHASAGGTIIAAGQIAENDGRYGNVVIIDHGAEQSLYAHLNSVNVVPGQRVAAGQLIGAVGETGFATGPHLHLEVRQNGRLIDPASRFDNLEAYATPRALRVRRQQKG
ncbi:peptidoglycan DD-metalloendopeptidase family protein [Pseudoduganella sp. FT55W]|uniref:Peptidoglycan DD-metalloendopeptidase family protein n=1 Tax=Duganella rivi TaxID=2666083 RepID=A0A7X4GQU2_9BURK|nr:M23/M56 family metallopeptidase [Duganella rivi]MYM67963.1 peptidoglycan DD-metalloendopeptidase family protein [Duganella rivi]